MASETVNVRYRVGDVEAAVAWYTGHLGFTLLTKQAPAFADAACFNRTDRPAAAG
jgi:catechol 2,3-dioxygenase-like lactoylglutathione lyase family enzyme